MDKVLIILLLLLLLLLIIYFYTSGCLENFTTNQEIKGDKISLYIFLTKNCKFCQEFDKDIYNKLVEEIGEKININKIYLNDETKDLFEKYNIAAVPTAILEKNNQILQ